MTCGRFCEPPGAKAVRYGWILARAEPLSAPARLFPSLKVRFHPRNSGLLASGSLDHEVRVWNATNAVCLAVQDFGARPKCNVWKRNQLSARGEH